VGFSIESDAGERDSFAEYRYRIHRDGRLVAHYWHDYRGDDHGIEFVDGPAASWPVGNLLDFIQGGGSRPVTLTPAAIAYLEAHTTASPSYSSSAAPMAAAVSRQPGQARPPGRNPGRRRRLFVVAALACWLACLFLPPLLLDKRDSSGWGLAYLLTGWMGPLAGHFEWFANPLLLAAAVALWRAHVRTAFVMALLACLLVLLLPIRGTIVADEGGSAVSILSFRLGFWLWLAAPSLLCLGALSSLRPAPPALPPR